MPRQARAARKALPIQPETQPALTPPVIDAATWRRVVERAGLSARQAEVVALIMRGLGDKQIVPALGIKYGTVRMHRERALGRLGLNGANRAEVTSRVFTLAWELLMDEPCPHCGCRRDHRQRKCHLSRE
ncbi:MAG: hypothetical protein BroJett005_29990 [Ignavibacteriota bacterium]|nr:MAG: hypothetical protein BroJett005_29990 [Ignavibacteriota bacterium]